MHNVIESSARRVNPFHDNGYLYYPAWFPRMLPQKMIAGYTYWCMNTGSHRRIAIDTLGIANQFTVA